METVLSYLASSVIPSLIALVAIWLQYTRNKAEIKKLKSETTTLEKDSTNSGGEVYLKWTQEFIKRMEYVEQKSKDLVEKVEEQDKIITNQNILIIDNNTRILKLETENTVLKDTVLKLEKEKSSLEARVLELEKENARLKEGKEV